MTEEQKNAFIILMARLAELDLITKKKGELGEVFLENLKEVSFEDACVYGASRGSLETKELEVKAELKVLMEKVGSVWPEVVKATAEQVMKEVE